MRHSAESFNRNAVKGELDVLLLEVGLAASRFLSFLLFSHTISSLVSLVFVFA